MDHNKSMLQQKPANPTGHDSNQDRTVIKLEPDPRNPELILTVRGIGYASQRVGETATSLAS